MPAGTLPVNGHAFLSLPVIQKAQVPGILLDCAARRPSVGQRQPHGVSYRVSRGRASKLLGKIVLGAVGIVAVLVAVVVVRTLTFKPPVSVDISSVKLAAAPAIDQALAAQHLSQAVRIRTISHQDKADKLAKAITAIIGNAFPLRLEGPGAQMISTLAAHGSFVTRMAVANRWLFGPMLKAKVAATPAGAALLHTTIAPTMLKGSPKENVLPQDAAAWINYRIAPGQTTDDVMNAAKAATKGLDVELKWAGAVINPSPVSSTSSEGWKLIAALASDGGRLPVAPGLVGAGTDSRYMTPIASDIYRYQPILANMDAFGMIHGTNEYMTLENLARPAA